MANALFGFTNRTLTATLTGSSEAVGLGVTQLQTDTGSASTAWQTTGPSGTLTIDTGLDASTWRLFLLARTNLTPAATTRVRIGSMRALVEAPLTLAHLFTNQTTASLAGLGWTFTRSSTGLLLSADGQTYTAYGNDLARANATGLLIEAAATNVFYYNSTSVGLGTTEGTITVTTTPPALYSSASRYAVSKSSGTDNAFFYSYIGGLTAGTEYTVSTFLYLPSGSPAASAFFFVDDGAAAATVVRASPANVAIKSAWQRMSVSVVVPSNGVVRAILRITGMTLGATAYVTCWQCESGRVPTSYIHTAGAAASRAGDNVQNTGISAALADGAYSMAMDCITPVLASGSIGGLNFQSQSATQPALLLRQDASCVVYQWSVSGGYAIVSINTATAGGYTRIVSSTDGARVVGDATGLANPVSVTEPYTSPIPDRIAILATEGSSVVVAVWLWPDTLTASQVRSFRDTQSTMTTAELTYDSGIIAASVASGFGQVVVSTPAQVAGQAVRIDLADSANPDGFLNLPFVYAGPAWQPLTNPDWTTTFGRDDQTDEVVSRGGQEFPSTQWVRRRWDVSLQGIRGAELWPQVMEFDRVSRTNVNIAFVPDPTGANVQREAVFGRAKATADVTYPFGSADRRAWKTRITERL